MYNVKDVQFKPTLLQKDQIIIRFRFKFWDIYGPLMDQDLALILWGSALLSLESIVMFLLRRMEKIIRIQQEHEVAILKEEFFR